MRNVTFVDRVEVPGVTSTSSTNLFLYDVDNDGDIELVVGHWDLGDLDPYKESVCPNGSLKIVKYGKIWKFHEGLGMVTSVTAGKFVSALKPSVVVLCADSRCCIFDAQSNPGDSKLFLIHEQKIACNAKDARIIEEGFVHGNFFTVIVDDHRELAVVYSDRIIRLFQWVPKGFPNFNAGELVLLVKWELAGQVSRISLHSSPTHQNLILASQPGGGFAFLEKKFETYENKICPTLVYHPPKPSPNHNTETRTWITGGLRCKTFKGTEHLIGLCLADGTIHLLSADLQKNETMWSLSLPVNGELFGLSKFDLTGDGSDELAVCCWDGSTYIFSLERNVLHFPVGQACQAFTAGRMAVEPGLNEPVLVYATCEQSTLIYYNLAVHTVPSFSFFHALHRRPEVLERLKLFSRERSDHASLRRSIHYLLYELLCHPKKFVSP